MGQYLIVVAVIFGLMLAGIGVDRLYRSFAARHPQLGPFRKNDGGCGCCSSSGSCGSDGGCH